MRAELTTGTNERCLFENEPWAQVLHHLFSALRSNQEPFMDFLGNFSSPRQFPKNSKLKPVTLNGFR